MPHADGRTQRGRAARRPESSGGDGGTCCAGRAGAPPPRPTTTAGRRTVPLPDRISPPWRLARQPPRRAAHMPRGRSAGEPEKGPRRMRGRERCSRNPPRAHTVPPLPRHPDTIHASAGPPTPSSRALPLAAEIVVYSPRCFRSYRYFACPFHTTQCSYRGPTSCVDAAFLLFASPQPRLPFWTPLTCALLMAGAS